MHVLSVHVFFLSIFKISPQNMYFTKEETLAEIQHYIETNTGLYNDFKEMRQDMTYTGSSGGKTNGNPVLKGKSIKGNFLYNAETGEYVHSAYARITIRRKR